MLEIVSDSQGTFVKENSQGIKTGELGDASVPLKSSWVESHATQLSWTKSTPAP